MTIRILLVDDSPTLILAVRQFLATLPGVDVCGEAHDGREGLALAARLKPDLILLDITMPIMNGLDMARTLQTWPQAPRVVFLSIQDGTAYSAIAEKLGAIALVRKSDLVEGLPPIIQRLLGQRREKDPASTLADRSYL
jgi:DNA-binding NarL/FixJ family response regulator